MLLLSCTATTTKACREKTTFCPGKDVEKSWNAIVRTVSVSTEEDYLRRLASHLQVIQEQSEMVSSEHVKSKCPSPCWWAS